MEPQWPIKEARIGTVQSPEGRYATCPRDYMRWMMMDLFNIRFDQAEDILTRYVEDGANALTPAEWEQYVGANRALFVLGYRVRGVE